MKSFIYSKKVHLNEVPEKSGVYLFKNKEGDILYVGKAKNLRSRLKSYFAKDLGIKTRKMVSSAEKISYITVNSEIEALLLEAKLVKKYQPKYNIELRDDKSPLYIGITDEEYPRVITLRQTQIENIKLKKLFGPFLNSTAPKKVLRNFRKIVPFSMHAPSKRACVYSQIGLCNPCPSIIKHTIDKQEKQNLQIEYKKNIQKISRMLGGQIKSVRDEYLKEMSKYSKNEDFESANKIKNYLNQIDYVLSEHVSADSYISNPNLLEDIRMEELNQLKETISPFYKIKNLSRIECYDIAHLSGSYPTASMVVFINGAADKSQYRHFKVRQKNSNDDYASMKEILGRRINHFDDWGVPDLIIVDGGKGQLQSVKEYFRESKIPVLGLAKRYETLIFSDDQSKFHERVVPRGPALNLLQRIRDEAHRFARRLHHNNVSKSIKELNN